MDDKEAKNIDGIKMPDDAAKDTAEQISVTVNKSNTEVPEPVVATNDSEDTTAQTNTEPTVDASTPVEPVKEETPAQIEEKPAEMILPEEPKPSSDDPGIVPSVQPATQVAATPATEVARLKERVKHLKIWLVVLMLLLVAVASALVVYFASQSNKSSELQAAQKQNAELQAELQAQEQTATQKTIDDLNTSLEEEKAKNAELLKTVDEQAAQITEYQKAVKALLEKCGSACNSVTVPEDTTDNNTTN